MPLAGGYVLISLGEDGQMGPYPTPNDPDDDIKSFRELQ